MKNNINNLTFKEYLKIVNENNKWHDSSAYAQRQVQKYSFEGSFDKTVYNFERFGINFSIREQITDRWKNHNSYGQRDIDGEYLRDNHGQIIKHDSKTIKELFPEDKRFFYEHAIFDDDKELMVSRTQDEWGCLLIVSLEDYQGFGLGEELLYHHRKTYPFRHSGGYTPSGYNCEGQAFRRLVLENDKKNVYNHLPKERRLEILDSVNKFETFGERHEDDLKNKDFDLSNQKDWYFSINERFIVIYNKKIFDILKNDEVDMDYPRNQHFLNKSVVGFMCLLGNSETNRIFKMHYQSEAVLNTMLHFFARHNKIEEFEIYKRDISDFKNFSGLNIKTGRDFAKFNITPDIDVDTKLLNSIEKSFRKKIDPYEEKWCLIHETAESLADEHLKENHQNFENKKRKKFNI